MNDSPSFNDLPRAQRLAEQALSTLHRFLYVEAVSGAALVVAAAAALIWANSPFADSYHAFWNLPLTIGVGEHVISRSLHFWVNDALMTVFFLVVGMEIRREVHEGALSKVDQAILPLVAATGGVFVPALIYLSLNSDPGRGQGWAVPTATDIAFAVGVLALLGRTIPVNVRVFLLALAIIDDIIAVVIIALFYTASLQLGGFIIASIGVLAVLGCQRIGIGSAPFYVLPSSLVWIGLMIAGIQSNPCRCGARADNSGTRHANAGGAAGSRVASAQAVAKQRCGERKGSAPVGATAARPSRSSPRDIAAGVAGADGNASVGGLRRHADLRAGECRRQPNGR